jgi:ABC-2 type transport system ATP-binding protein
MQEVSAVCDRVMIINKGKIVATDTLENLTSGMNQGTKLILRVKGQQNDVKNALNELSIIKNIKFDGTKEKGTVDFFVSGDMDLREALFSAMSKHKLPIYSMRPFALSLEDIFLKVVTGTSTNDMEGGL